MPLTNPFRKSLCPYCFEQFYLADCEIVSSRRVDPNTNQAVLLREAPIGFDRAVARLWLDSLAGAAYSQELATRRCPHCQESLPHNLEHMDNRIIGLVGGGASGKGHFIASLLHALQQADGTKWGCTRFMPLDQTVDAAYRRLYYDPIFVHHQQLQGSQLGGLGIKNRPLIYVMLFQGANPQQAVKRLNLILFDAAGEDLTNETLLVQFGRYVLNASGLIFLVDPLTLPGVLERLPPHLRPTPAPHKEREALQILNRMVSLYQRYKGLKPEDKLPIPVAVTLAKSDLLKYVIDNLGQHAVFMQDSDHSQGVHLQNLQLVHDEVVELLTRLDGPGFVQQAQSALARMTFCAVSATGGAPDSTGIYQTLSPRRCLDPLLWLLWQLNFVESATPPRP